MKDKLLSTGELADHFGLTLDAIRKRIKRHDIPVVRTYGMTKMYDPEQVGRILDLEPVKRKRRK